MKKIAIIHDYLCGLGGSERVFQYLCEEFKEADIFTLSYNPKRTLPEFLKYKIHTTFLNKFAQTPQSFRLLFPIATYAMQWLDLSQYDLVLSSSASTAKYVRVPNGKHVCYCYIPTRAIWHFNEYFGNNLKSKILKPIFSLLKKRDHKIAQKIDQFIAISQSSRDYIKKYYQRDSNIINSPIETQKFYPSDKKQDYFLIVSRLEHWKRVDYAVEAFNALSLSLKVVGTGAEKEKLQSLANKNITFLGDVDDQTLARLYSECKAVIFTPFLEYGLIPLEANASGTPVICYGKGGITETMIPSDNTKGEKPTAVFFYEQTANSLIQALKIFEKQPFESSYLVQHAMKWNVDNFKKQIREQVNQSFALT